MWQKKKWKEREGFENYQYDICWHSTSAVDPLSMKTSWKPFSKCFQHFQQYFRCFSRSKTSSKHYLLTQVSKSQHFWQLELTGVINHNSFHNSFIFHFISNITHLIKKWSICECDFVKCESSSQVFGHNWNIVVSSVWKLEPLALQKSKGIPLHQYIFNIWFTSKWKRSYSSIVALWWEVISSKRCLKSRCWKRSCPRRNSVVFRDLSLKNSMFFFRVTSNRTSKAKVGNVHLLSKLFHFDLYLNSSFSRGTWEVDCQNRWRSRKEWTN